MLALSDPYLKYLQISLNLEGWNIGRYLKEVLVMQDKSIYYTKGSEKGGGEARYVFVAGTVCRKV